MSVFPENLAARAGFEGPQIVVTWDNLDLTSIDGYKIMRKKVSYPVDADDGKLMVEEYGAGPFQTSFVDTEVETGEVYYYQMFTREIGTGDLKTGIIARVSALALETQFFRKRLFTLLPPLYTQADQGIM